jgi:hypothetical protein
MQGKPLTEASGGGGLLFRQPQSLIQPQLNKLFNLDDYSNYNMILNAKISHYISKRQKRPE